MRKQKNNIKDDFVITLLIAIAIAAVITFIVKYLGIIVLCIFVVCLIGFAIWLVLKSLKKSSPNTSNSVDQIAENQVEADPEVEEAKKLNNDYSGKYEARPLLTDHEMNFYRGLKPITDKLGISIISKVRMADLVKPTANYYQEHSEYMSYFGKIKSKHVDFVLCDPDTLKVRLLIELDDKSHEANRVIDRDEFVEIVYRDTGYKLLRTYTDWDLEKKIRDALGITDDISDIGHNWKSCIR